MKAIRIHQYGGPEVLRFEQVPRPLPDPDQVLVRVHAAGVNPSDWKTRSGYLQQMTPLKLPFTLGGDFSGTVETVGADVRRFKRGDEVYGRAVTWNGDSGSFAEFTIASASNIAHKPSTLSHTEAAGLPLVGVSALQALTEYLRLSTGQRILIHGGAGGVGSMAIQMAKHLGAHVATTVNAADVEFAKLLGATQVVDYQEQKFEEVLCGMDAVFDTVGADTYVRSFKVLKQGGRIVSLIQQPMLELAEQFAVEAYLQSTRVTLERLNALTKLVEQGALELYLGQTYPLEHAAWALLQLERGMPKGKVVLSIA